MKMPKALLFALLTFGVVLMIYYFDYKAEEKQLNNEQAYISNQAISGINYINVIKDDLKVGLQKNEDGKWYVIEPIQDAADDFKIEELLIQLGKQRQISIAKKSESDFSIDDLKEFGLDKPAIEFSFKNKSGLTKKISVGRVKNFEGYSFLRVDSENKILLADPIWFEKSNYGLIYYREKKLYRDNLANIVKVKVKSLREKFELQLKNDKWQLVNSEVSLDQNRVRDVLKKISETNIVQYVFEGEPSTKLISEKGLSNTDVNLELHTQSSFWSVNLSLRPDEKALYALTERPTYLVKIEIPAWETIGNLNIDSLRDRTSALAFNLKEVQNFYYKTESDEFNFSFVAGAWKSKSLSSANISPNPEKLKNLIEKVHNLKISEFLDTPASQGKFEGKNMLILKSLNQKLVLQLNWGPLFKMNKGGKSNEYYYARTHLYGDTFAIEKKLIDELEFKTLISEHNSNSLDQAVQSKAGATIE